MAFNVGDPVINSDMVIIDNDTIPAQTDGVIISTANGSATVEFTLADGSKLQKRVMEMLLEGAARKTTAAELKAQKLTDVLTTLGTHQTRLEGTPTNAQVIAAVLYLVKVMTVLVKIVARELI